MRTRRLIQFANYQVDLDAGELRKSDRKLKLSGQPFQVLTILLEHPGEVVTREELQKRLWPDSFVDFDHNLNTAVNKIREVLCDSADNPRFVETLPRKGYRFIAPVESPQRGAISVEAPIANGEKPRRSRTLGIALMLFGAGALLAGTAWYVMRPKVPTSHVQRPLMRVTFDEGLQTEPTWSPDGRFIAYTSDRGGKLDIWLQQVSGGDPVQITHSAGNNYQPDWSPNGNLIAYRSEEGGGGLFVIPAWPGQGLERKITSFGYLPRWSPDGSQILFQTHFMGIDYDHRFYVVRLNGGPPREVLSEFFKQHKLPADVATWHPDGKRLTVGVSEPELGPVPSFWTVPLDGGATIKSEINPTIARELQEVGSGGGRQEWVGLDSIVWDPSGTAIYFQRYYRGTNNIWRLIVNPETLQSVAIERLTTGSGPDTHPAVSPDGKRLAFSVTPENNRLWLQPFNASSGRISGNARPLTSPGMGSFVQTLPRDGKKMAFIGIRGSLGDIWETSLVDGHEAPLIAGDYERYYPRWSRDGLGLAYTRRRPFISKQQVVVWSSVSHAEEPVTRESDRYEVVCDFTPDGKGLVVSQVNGDGRNEVWLMPLAAAPHAETEARKVIADPAYDLQQAHFSPDGQWIAFTATVNSPQAAESTVYVMPARGGPWTRITEGQWDDKPTWSPDGTMIYFFSNADGFLNVWGIRFDRAKGKPVGKPFQVTAFEKPSLMVFPHPGAIGLSVQQSSLISTLSELSGSIWVMDNVNQ
jgi:Tol biopolymer transport system component/DNA-binding winged helix-turn-helix (wHTH) protein